MNKLNSIKKNINIINNIENINNNIIKKIYLEGFI